LFDWPLEALPEPFGTFVRELARSTETPVDLAAMLSLVVVSAITQHKYRVQVKEDYSEPMNIWAAGVLPPASRKSGVFNRVTEPLKQWESKEKQKLEPEIKKANSKKLVLEERLKLLRNRAAREENNDKRKKVHEQIECLEQELPTVPLCPRLIVADITPEKLGELMSMHNGAIAVLSDEGGIIDILGGLYSNGQANLDLFLQAYTGSRVRIDRKSSPPIEMDNPLLAVGLTIQPSVIEGMCKKPTFRGRGLLGRILFVMPASNIGCRSCNEAPMNRSVTEAYGQACADILHDCLLEKRGKERILSLTPEAYEEWLKNSRRIERDMSPDGGHLSDITDWAGKLSGAIARIAGNLHVMQHYSFDPGAISISQETMWGAIKIGKALEQHALKVFDYMEIGSARQDARKVFKWIKSERLTNFFRRDCSRRFRGLKKEALTLVLDILVEHGIIQYAEAQEKNKGRPRELFVVNQFIIDEYKQ
jgi:hypothetical protein